MKNFKLNRTPIDIGVMKKHLFLKSLWIAIGLLVTGLTTQAWATWTVAGDNTKFINGASTWTPSQTADDMTNTSGTKWVLLKKGQALSTSDKKIEFKVCKDHGWDTAYPGDNYYLGDVSTNATYNIIYVFDTGNSNTVWAAYYTGWRVVGDAAVFGNGWDTDDTDNDMTKTSDYVYTLTKKNVNLSATTYNFKCITPEDKYKFNRPSDNKSFSIATAGRYDVTITLDLRDAASSSQGVSVTAVAATYNITLHDNNGGSNNGSAVATWKSTSLSSVSAPTRSNYHVEGYYTNSACTTKVATPAGALQASATYTDANSKWSSASNQTLYAKWEGDSWGITYKDEGNVSYSGSNSASLPSSYRYGTGVALVDGVKSNYRFDGWYDNSSCTGDPVTSVSSSATGSKIFYAKWTENPGGTITLSAGTGGQVSKNGSSWSSSASYTGIKTTDALNIYAQASTGYSFSSWSRTAGSGTLASTSNASTTFTPVANTDATVTASFTENMSDLTTSCSYDAGNPSYSAPTVSNSATTIGYVTERTITAAAAGTGYTFAGWTITNGTRTDGGGATANPITVRSNGDSDDVSVVANYNEVLTSRWHLVGLNESGYEIFPDGWSVSSTSMMEKISGHAEDDTVAMDITVTYADRTYLFKVVDDNGVSSDLWYGYSNGDTYLEWTATSEKTVYEANDGGSGNNSNNLKFTPTVAGTYKFQVDYSGSKPKVKITYPTSYTLNYSVGLVKGNKSAITSSPTTTSGSLVISGSTIRLTASDPKDGYEFWGWFSKSNPDNNTDGRLTSSASYDVTVSANTTVYACYAQIRYITYATAGANGSVSPKTVYARVATASDEITATPNTGYYLSSWTLPDSITAASTYTATSNPIRVNAIADKKTITANFSPRWTMPGDKWPDESAWSTSSNPVTGYLHTTTPARDSGFVSVTLAANTCYSFKMYDHAGDGDKYYGRPSAEEDDMYYADNHYAWEMTNESGNNNFRLNTAGAGTYNFTWDLTNKTLSVVYPTSYTVTHGTVTNTGATKGSVTATGDDDAELGTGQYVAKGTATFTASDAAGYHFVAWRSSSTYGGGSQLSTTQADYEMSSISANKIVYANYAENLCTVTIKANDNTKGSITVGGAAFAWDGTTNVGITTTKALVVTPAEGYYFSGWTLSDTPDFAVGNTGESGASTTLRGLGGTDGSTGTLTANFVELDKIYFRNLSTMEGGAWANVYVYFGVTWNGYENAVSNSNAAYKVAMTQIGSSDVYWAYVPRSFTTSAGTAIAFSNQSVGTSTAINTGEAATRNDYNKALQMYVPSVAWVDHGAHYHNDGYWKNYPVKAATGAGYYLQTTRGTNLVEFTGQADNLDIIECTVRVDQHDEDKTFHIKSAGGIYFEQYDYDGETYPKITSIASTMTMKSGDTDGLIVTLTSEGDYKFILDQSSDVMVLTVVYPIGLGDYRIKHSYSDSGTKYAYSDIIKNGDSHPTVSMFYNPASATMVLQKCTLVNASGPEWNAGTAIEMTKLNKGAGVYQFDLTISDDAGTIDDGAGLYDGPFYIKTDCAPGGWANYKQNVMDINTINASDFDHYFCKNIGSGTNVKFVVANDFNIAISDTIVADNTYLTTSGGGSSKEYTPEASCIRFSYNSATNEAKRAYLRYSNNNNFLNVIPTGSGTVYSEEDGTSDLSGAAEATSKMSEDEGNFVYQKTVYAKSTGAISIRATYNSQNQTFATSPSMITSSNESAVYPIHVVYDFKTNNLTTAWQPGDNPISAAISDVDYMYIRNGQAAADQLSFSGSGALTDAKVCGAFQFAYDDYVGRVGAWPQQDGQSTGYTYSKCMFYFSFPFNVKVSDIFGIGTYGKEWKIQYYDGEERAKKGFFRGDGTTTFWKDMPLGDTLKAYRGYSLLLDNDYFNTTASGMVFNGKSAGSSVFLYFPSYQTMEEVATDDKEITIDPLPCTLTNSWVDSESGNTLCHSNTDSHWNMLGVPLLNSQTGNFSTTFTQSGLSYLYEWDPTTNTLSPAATGSSAGQIGNFTFKAMGAYMVQFAGKITFHGSVATPASVAARQKKETKNYTVDLEVLDAEDTRINHTYVELREGASDDFMLNEDMYMTRNSNAVNIYSFAGDYDVAANVLSLGNHVVPVGVAVTKAGTYKFSMPYEFSGTVTLVDKFNNTRTNLAFDEYEVYLEKGSINDRFDMEINIHKVPTSIENVDGNNALNDGGVHKFIENDQMYILKNGAIYNAQGAKVK